MTMRALILSQFYCWWLTCAFAQGFEADSLLRHLTYDISRTEKTSTLLQLANLKLETDPVASLEYAQQASGLAMQIDSDSLLGYANLFQGNAFLHGGSYARALQSYVEVIPNGIERKDSLFLVMAYANMGNVYYFQRDYENALKNDVQALVYFPKKSQDQTLLIKKANLLSNIGSIYEETRQFATAEKYYDEAYAIAVALNSHEISGNVLNNRGTLYRDQGDDEMALKYYLDALKLREKHGNTFGIARSNYSLGLYYFNHKDYDLANYHLSKSVELGRKVGSMQTVRSAAEYLYQSQNKTGDFEESLKTLELYMLIKDSLYNEQNTRKIAQLEMQFEFDKKQKEAEAFQKQRELYYLLGATILALLFLSAIILFLIQKNKVRKAEVKEAYLQLERTHLKNNLEAKDKELATNVMFLLEKNELINSISEKLLIIKSELPTLSQSALQRVILDLQSNIQPDLWQEFEFRFQQVYENFYRILTERFPDLTPAERRLCAFLKLNMTTKEISALTHQNSKSIDVARTRLRKKLGLTGTDQNLVTFLEQLETNAEGTTSSIKIHSRLSPE